MDKMLIILGIYLVTSGCTNIAPINSKQDKVNPSIPQLMAKPTVKKETKLTDLSPNSDVHNKVLHDQSGPIETLTFKNTDKVEKYCTKLDRYFKKYKWGKSNCSDYSWHHVRSSHWGNPIIWFTYGDEKKHEEQPKNTTMIFCGVHGDEITPVKFCFDVLKDLKNHPEIIKDNLVVIAPLVTPDSFLRKYPTRYNGRGVDVNRNFPTKDWNKMAKKLWKTRYNADKRRNPGNKPLSEQDTIFQVNLIKRYKPNKIISVHAPLTLIDYDGPTSPHKHGDLAHQLLIQMSAKAGKYKINNYPFFTGSLGNWAGNERNIPTYTLELPNTDWTKTRKFFKTFRTAIHHAITHELVTSEDKKKLTTHSKATKTKGNDKVL
jgi:protein MpaA